MQYTHPPQKKKVCMWFMHTHNTTNNKGELVCTDMHTQTQSGSWIIELYLAGHTALLLFIWPAAECLGGKVRGAAQSDQQ